MWFIVSSYLTSVNLFYCSTQVVAATEHDESMDVVNETLSQLERSPSWDSAHSDDLFDSQEPDESIKERQVHPAKVA
ncbi:unnamed protein product [Gongylonema pulchrum]|uniref:Secreted protein n=1 Tax=Gongylonema pulchrum TaxID=637853 RepID=A0A183EHG3_9BILA|nr:unnamed protein product [Gongylonema pulchrum]